jgi:hypothetical protein
MGLEESDCEIIGAFFQHLRERTEEDRKTLSGYRYQD